MRRARRVRAGCATQVLVELHWPGAADGDGALFGLMRGLHAWGFRVFHREPNVANVQRCWEFALAQVGSNRQELAAAAAGRQAARGSTADCARAEGGCSCEWACFPFEGVNERVLTACVPPAKGGAGGRGRGGRLPARLPRGGARCGVAGCVAAASLQRSGELGPYRRRRPTAVQRQAVAPLALSFWVRLYFAYVASEF